MDDGSFYSLSFFERYRKIREIKKLYNRLLGSLSEASVRGAVSFASVLMLLAAPGCDDDGGMATVKIDLAMNRQNSITPGLYRAMTPSEVTGMTLTVKGPGIKTFSRELPLDEDSIMLMVPAGRDRVFSLRAETGTMYFYAGREKVDLANGEMRKVPITMVRGPVFNTTGTQVTGINLGTSDRVYPSFGDLDGDGDKDLMLSGSPGSAVLHLYENQSGSFTEITVPNDLIYPFDPRAYYGFRVITDIDGDGDIDVLNTTINNNELYSFINNSATGSFDSFYDPAILINDITDGSYRGIVTLGDLDNDGDLDFIAGREGLDIGDSHTLQFYQNTGAAASPAFSPAVDVGPSINFANAISPVLVDIDYDGDLDIFIGVGIYAGSITGHTRLLFNSGNAQNQEFPEIIISDPFGIDENLSTTNVVFPAFADLDNDGDQDLYIGTSNGTILYFENLLFQ